MTEKKFDALKKIKNIPLSRAIAWGVALVAAIGIFVFLRGFVASFDLLELPGMAVTNSSGEALDPVAGSEPTPEVVAPASDLPEAWDGASRVTILFLGLDQRDTDAEVDAPRSDTMIVFTMDPVSKTAGMLSIPRDMWVSIPGGFDYGKINTAYALGEAYKLPGGGPALAVQTVEKFLGVPIQYYAQVDFHAFEESIDAMGGLYICIPENIWLDPIGPKPKQKIKNECQVLPGYLALAYARNRKATEGGDVDRAARQQLVIMALRDQVLAPENFPSMVAMAPAIYAEAEKGLRTNLSFDDALRLAALASQIDVSNIKQGIIDYDMAILETSPDGLSIVKPLPDKIRILRDEIFNPGGALSPLATGELSDLMQAEGVRVGVLNGAYGIGEATGLAERTSNYLLSQGVNVVSFGSAENVTDRTKIVLRNPSLYTMRFLSDLLGANGGSQILFRYDPTAATDIDVIVGNNWALNNPMQ